MVWYSVGVPLLLQLAVPVIALVGLVASRRASRALFLAVALCVMSYIVAVGVAGLWLVLPWYLPLIYGFSAGAIVLSARRRILRAPGWPVSWTGRTLFGASLVLAMLMFGVAAVAVLARRAPGPVVDLEFPLGSGTYLVVNGGASTLINAHVQTIEGERFTPYRGQSYGVDIVRVNALGLRARGLLPADPAAYVIFGDPVMAPCAGRVVVASDGFADQAPPRVDRAHMAGNHVILECGSTWVVLGHLESGSVAVRADEPVDVGQLLGRVGNSGNTGEPHLHVHVQQPGSATEPLGGQPIAVRFGGRYLVRNDRVHAAGGST